MTKPRLSDSIVLISPTVFCMISGYAACSTPQLGPGKWPRYCAHTSVGQEIGQGLVRTAHFCFMVSGTSPGKTQSWGDSIAWSDSTIMMVISGGSFTSLYAVCWLVSQPWQSAKSPTVMPSWETWQPETPLGGSSLWRQKSSRSCISFHCPLLCTLLVSCSRGGVVDPTSPWESVSFQTCWKPL